MAKQKPLDKLQHIHRHGERWRVHIRRLGIRKGGFVSQEEAKTFRDAMLQTVEAEVRYDIPAHKVTIRDAFKMTADRIRNEGKSEATIDFYEERCDWWIEWLGNKPLVDITVAEINNALAKERKRGVGPNTIHKTRGALVTFFSRAVDIAGVPVNTAMRSDKPYVPAPAIGERPPCIPLDECLRIFQTMRETDLREGKAERDADAFTFLALTGIRSEEAQRLKIADICEEYIVVQRGKRHGKRFVPYDEAVLGPVLDRMMAGKPHNAFLMPFRLSTRFHDWRERLRQPRVLFSPRGLRHSCITSWVDAGVPIAKVARWAGTSIEQIDKRYYHSTIDDSDRALLSQIGAEKSNVVPIRKKA